MNIFKSLRFSVNWRSATTARVEKHLIKTDRTLWERNFIIITLTQILQAFPAQMHAASKLFQNFGGNFHCLRCYASCQYESINNEEIKCSKLYIIATLTLKQKEHCSSPGHLVHCVCSILMKAVSNCSVLCAINSFRSITLWSMIVLRRARQVSHAAYVACLRSPVQHNQQYRMVALT